MGFRRGSRIERLGYNGHGGRVDCFHGAAVGLDSPCGCVCKRGAGPTWADEEQALRQ